ESIYWVNSRERALNLTAVPTKPAKKAESEEDILAREKTARSPKFDIKLYPYRSDAVTPYKPPLRLYVLGVQNLNRDSVPVLDLRLEFHFRNIINAVKPQVLLVGGRASSMGGMKVYKKRKDGSISAYE